MAVTRTRSPPTSRVIEARSSVVATTARLPASRDAAPRKRRLTIANNACAFMGPPLEDVGAMGADGEQQLEEDLVPGLPHRRSGPPELAADLTELAGPVGEGQGVALVEAPRLVGLLRAVVADSGEPASGGLVLRRRVHAEAVMPVVLLLEPAPDQLGAGQKATVDGAPEGAVAEGDVDADQPPR